MYNTFEELEESIKGCNKCKLYKTTFREIWY